jgi:transposase-like protein
MGKRRKFSNEFKAKVALAAIKGDRTMAELSSEYGVHGNMINRWKKDVLEQLPSFFGNTNGHDSDKDQLIENLYKQIGKLSVHNDWLKKKLGY